MVSETGTKNIRVKNIACFLLVKQGVLLAISTYNKKRCRNIFVLDQENLCKKVKVCSNRICVNNPAGGFV